MRGLWQPLFWIAVALAVPIVAFLCFGDVLEAKVSGWLDPPPGPGMLAALTVVVLASDILLPVPSSLVSTIAGAQLGIVLATMASWLGMMLGAMLGFQLARSCGRPLAAKLSSPDDLGRMDRLAQRYGASILIASRALPVLAEAAVLLMGLTQLSWRKFLPAVMLSNLGIAFVYSVLGRLASDRGELPLALGASIALPLLATTIARRWLR